MAFATTSDVATRLGRDLTTAETASAQLAIDVTQGAIAEAVSKTVAWATALTPVPAYLRVLCVEKAVQVLANPHSVASHTKQIGAMSESETFQRSQDGGIFLTDDEERRCRRVVWGRTTDSVMLGSSFQEVESS